MQTILDISTFIWLMPLIRNFNGNYRWLFLALGISDLLFLFLHYIGIEDPNWGIVMIDAFIVILYNRKYFTVNYVSKNSLLYFGALFIIWVVEAKVHEAILLFDLIIIGKSLKVIFDEILLEKKVNLFSFALTLNFLLIMLNTLFIIINPSMGAGYYYSTLILLMIFAVFFTIFSDTSKVLIFSLKKIRRQNNGN